MIVYVVKMPSGPTTIFISFNVRLMDPKPLFKIKCRAFVVYNYYILLNI